jgi:carboxymethylenebutenolidase
MRQSGVWAEPGKGYLAVPEMGVGPGVMVLHAWWGLTAFFRKVCDRLAQVGFTALAPDLYHGAVASTNEEAKCLRFGLDNDRVDREIGAALACLRNHAAASGLSVGVIGFSLGGYLALRLARTRADEVRAVVVFYATDGGRFDTAQASFLGHFAENDGCWAGVRTVRSLEERLRAAGREAIFHTYPGTEHSFSEEDRPEAYNVQAARLAWQRTVEFLWTCLARPQAARAALWRLGQRTARIPTHLRSADAQGSL